MSAQWLAVLLAAGAVLTSARPVRRVVRGPRPGIPSRLGWRPRRPPDLLPALVVLTAELRAGRPLPVALATAADSGDPDGVLRKAATALQLGGDARGLLADGGPALRHVAAAFEVSAATGAGLADVLDRVCDALRGEVRHRAEVAAQLAGPRASAGVLALLPIAGVLLAAGLGAAPGEVLLGSPAGATALAAGVGLDVAGLLWVRRITRRAESG